MAGRRPSLTALARTGLAATGFLLSLSSGTAAMAKPAFTGYFPASVYWGNSEYDPVKGTGTGIYYINLDKSASTRYEQDQNTAITFYADKEATQLIDKQAEPTSGPLDIALIDLTFKNTSDTGRGSKTIYKITFKWNFDPLNNRCNAGMATNDPSKNADCSWTFDDVAKLSGSETLAEDGSVINLAAYDTPSKIYLASGASVTFRSAINYSRPRPPDSQKVPAPLPALGAGAAFGMSRRLRRRLRRGDILNTTAVPGAPPALIPATPIAAAVAARQHRQQVANRYGALLGGPRPM
jgi:hypothetical protein